MLWESCCAAAMGAVTVETGIFDCEVDGMAFGGNGGDNPPRNGNVVDGGEDSTRGGNCTVSCTS